MFHRRWMGVLCASCVTLAGAAAQAGLINYSGQSVYVEYTAGSGPDQTLVLVEFEDGVSGAFLYQWDSTVITPDTFQAVQAIVDAGALDFHYVSFSFGNLIDQFTYLGHQLSDKFFSTGEWLGYYDSTNGTTWSSGFGVTGDLVNNGDWRGFALQPPFGSGSPDNFAAIPTSAVTPTPEPATLGLLAVVGSAALIRRRRSV